MGRLGPHAVPPPRTRQGVLKKKVYKKQGVKKKKKKKKVSTKKLGYVRDTLYPPAAGRLAKFCKKYYPCSLFHSVCLCESLYVVY